MSIRFPVLRRVSVERYGLFPNGLTHDFQPGVSLVVGINGLGKTTILNILYRALLGPRDLSKDDAALSSSQHTLAPWRTPRYFRARVMDDAAGASSQVTISFGEQELLVRRSLRDMAVQRLELDGAAQDPSQERYESLARDLSGTASFFDFAAILRFLVFFLEDRPELIWDQRSQFDMLRLLFYDRQAAEEAAAAYDAAQRADSRYRNRRVPIRAAQATLDALHAAERSGLAQQMRATTIALEAAREATQDRSAMLEEQMAAEREARLRREKALLELEEARRAYEREQQLHYAHVFPTIGDTARHVFINLLSGGGCLVCGDQSAAAATRVSVFTERGQCPICESVPARQEHVVPSGEFNARRLQREANRVEGLRQAVTEQDSLLAAAAAEARALVDARQEDYQRVKRLEAELLGLRGQVAPGEDELVTAVDEEERRALEVTVRQGNAELVRLQADRAQEERRYKAIKESQAARLAGSIKAVKERFRDIARNLLAEHCELGEGLIERTIGQEGERIQFPTFQVRMSSGAFLRSLSDRTEATSVSESQREFIDLAFRMALMDVAAGPGGDAMLVIETPEASLDSLFITEAGTLFRTFAAAGGALGNVLIASTNLNSDNMIPALLGTAAAPELEAVDNDLGTSAGEPPRPRAPSPPPVPAAERDSRVLNLLELAAPNAALRRHGAYYRAKLFQALYGDVADGDRPGQDGGKGG